ncbi:MAG: uridine kinase [Candidatus Marinimicrobia bacterium]|jgi:uridine kinase|nr:uridine kinase [Candidatus Neomarinimicrobiota bacterium]MDP7060015.1 uridine kinase [Candidatus Neomarinimicrobiota bacterium]|tara:strand:- start:830 stop:1465 length:636 start_codon:yes stop_codon:yes gene_type:complete
MTNNVLLGIGGGTGSGKTVLSNNLLDKFNKDEIAIIRQDSYYRDLSHQTSQERARTNFDHPEALDFDLLTKHLEILLNDDPVEMPVYNFSTHTRTPIKKQLDPRPILILEGTMVLTHQQIRDKMDIKIYVETDADVRFIRRLQRDINERSRTMEDVIEQYMNTVRPMHEEFVEITKKYADIILPKGGDNSVAVDLIQTKIQTLLKEKMPNN